MTQVKAEVTVSVIYPGGEGQSISIPIAEDDAWRIMSASMDGTHEMIDEMMRSIEAASLPDDCKSLDIH